jgi:Putative peptidoglycan binding domain
VADEPLLMRGHSNPHKWVVYAQQLLNHARAGGMHLDVPENGVFDHAFEQEVAAFQSLNGLTQDGKVGPKTWAALHKAVDAGQQAASKAAEEADDQVRSAPREVHSAPGHKDDETYRVRKDANGDTVRVYDMDEQVISADHEWNKAVAAMTTMAQGNIEAQITYVLVAVEEFQASSRSQIEGFAQRAHRFLDESQVHFPWGLLVDGLEHGLSLAFEVSGAAAAAGSAGMWVFDKVKGALVGQLKSELETRADPVPNLQKRLEDGVVALVDHVVQQTALVVNDMKPVIPDYIETAMADYRQVSDDHQWISEMVAYFGFPASTTQTVTLPIRQQLQEQFNALIQQVEQELLASG